ncbi:hypothetical protein ACOTTU_07220 [Roseobacter sp. EG26]|uniref:hypothetical protein n=1 Tax=Roseobacter sp. EG26 TaxID=3412477 RepID=UPI0026020E0B|nr:hypothetical protein [uncultured Roseobacter sp.]
MVLKYAAVGVALALSACTTIDNETRTQKVLEGGLNDGQRYELRTREMAGPNGSFTQTRVVYRGLARTCVLDSPGDCESVARNLIDKYDELII